MEGQHLQQCGRLSFARRRGRVLTPSNLAAGRYERLTLRLLISKNF
jgi:hypothetical protein